MKDKVKIYVVYYMINSHIECAFLGAFYDYEKAEKSMIEWYEKDKDEDDDEFEILNYHIEEVELE